MRKLLAFLCLVLLGQSAYAQSWTVGQYTATLATGSTQNILGDGSDSRGGWAPAFEYELPDIATDGTTKTNDTLGPIGQFQTQAGGAHESKARFDCNDAYNEQADPILFPGTANSGHEHTFLGPVGVKGNIHNVTYNLLRTSGGNSTCYGNGMNRTLYWEPSLKVMRNGVAVTIRPSNIITYYVCGAISSGPTVGDPSKCTRFPRGLAMINGYNTADPNDNYAKAAINTANATTPGRYSYTTNGLVGWYCGTNNGTGLTAWSPSSGSRQPYLYTASGHPTLSCSDSAGSGDGYGLWVDVVSQNCWDGRNLTSPDGRSHMFNAVTDSAKSGGPGQVCPTGWFQIVQFQAKVRFAVTAAEIAAGAIWLSSDRMNASSTPADPSSPSTCRQAGAYFCNGETMHFDVFPAWDFGTGDNPGFMLKFFRSMGLTMRVKNSDGTSWTTITGDTPHEMGYGRIDSTTNTTVDNGSTYVDGYSSSNPKVVLDPPRTGNNRYYPLLNGTALPGTIIHTH